MAAVQMAERREEAAGKTCELLRYELPRGERMLVGRRVDGVVHVFDWPLGGEGRRYHVDSGVESMGELAALVDDYRRQAERLAVCPMSREAVERGFEGATSAS